MRTTNLFKNLNPFHSQLPEELQENSDADFQLIQHLIRSLTAKSLRKQKIKHLLCADDDTTTFIDKLPLELPNEVLQAHKDISQQFPIWLAALGGDENTIVLAGNGSKQLICTMFTKYVSEESDYAVLELNPASPQYTTKRGQYSVESNLKENMARQIPMIVMVHSADHPAAQSLIFDYLLPLRDAEPSRNGSLRIVLSTDSLFYLAQITLWNLQNRFLLYDYVHTFLDFRLELLQTELKKRANHRYLLGESELISLLIPEQILSRSELNQFTVQTATPDSSVSGDLASSYLSDEEDTSDDEPAPYVESSSDESLDNYPPPLKQPHSPPTSSRPAAPPPRARSQRRAPPIPSSTEFPPDTARRLIKSSAPSPCPTPPRGVYTRRRAAAETASNAITLATVHEVIHEIQQLHSGNIFNYIDELKRATKIVPNNPTLITLEPGRTANFSLNLQKLRLKGSDKYQLLISRDEFIAKLKNEVRS